MKRTTNKDHDWLGAMVASIAVVVVLCSGAPVAWAGAELFTADFEGGDLSEWDRIVPPDNTAPVLSLTPADGVVVMTEVPLISVSYEDRASGIALASLAITLDGAELTADCDVTPIGARCESPEPLAEGSHILAAEIADRAGNTAIAQASFVVSLSGTPPTLVVLEPPKVVVGEPRPLIEVGFTDTTGIALETVSIELDGSDLSPGCAIQTNGAVCASPKLALGRHALMVAVADQAGNRAELTYDFEFLASLPDDVPPVVVIRSPAMATVIEGDRSDIVVDHVDTISGIDPDSLRLTVDRDDLLPTCARTSTQTICPFPMLELGDHLLEVAIRDHAGNAGTASHSFEVLPESVAPVVDILEPAPGSVHQGAPAVVLAFEDHGAGIDPDMIRVSVDGGTTMPCTVSDVGLADCSLSPLTAGEHTLRATVDDLRGNRGSAETYFQVDLDLAIEITQPLDGTLTSEDTVLVSGEVAGEAETVEVAGIEATVSGGMFVAELLLREGSNRITAVARSSAGAIGVDTVSVVVDREAPILAITTPPDGLVTSAPHVMVAGEVSDPSSSNRAAQAPSVTVNGIDAEASPRSFLVAPFLLQPGVNLIRAEALDDAGNRAEHSITVTYRPEAEQRIEELLGNGQRATVGAVLPKPLVVRLTDALGRPLIQRPIAFEVSRGAGSLRKPPQSGRRIEVETDEQGLAQIDFVLGQRAGEGNHEVTARALGAPDAVIFCASARAQSAARLVAIPGDNHRGALAAMVGREAPFPLLVQAFDVFGNPVEHAEVEFEVQEGGGELAGLPSLRVTTDAEGKAVASVRLGSIPGPNINVVTATLVEVATPPVTFQLSGVEPGPEAATAIEGVLLDNQDAPVPGATIYIDGAPGGTVSASDGRFRLSPAPVGTVHLLVDGSTVTAPGEWPSVGYTFTTVSGLDNDLGKPLRLLPLDTGGSAIVGGADDVTLALDGVPGATLTVFANSVTFPDGHEEGQLSFTQVHTDKVPMQAPMGSDFMLAWTVQPSGTRFDPPARIAIPNADQPPGTVVDIFSFDHDLGEFVPVGTASVSEDGTQIVSTPGFGVIEAGWHGCLPPPPPTGNGCNPGACSICVAGPEGVKALVPRCDIACQTCTGSGCENRGVEMVTVRADNQRDDAITDTERAVTFLADVQSDCTELDFTWTFGDGSAPSHEPSPTHVYEEPGSYTASTLVRCKDCGQSESQTDAVTVHVIEIDLQTDSDNDGAIAEADDEVEEMSPGRIVLWNGDDDDENDTPDRNDQGAVPMEDDLAEVRLVFDPDPTSLGIDDLTLEFESSDPIRLWEQESKGTRISTERSYAFGTDRIPTTIWAEGYEPGESSLKVILRRGGDDVGDDEVILTAARIQLEVIDFTGSGNVDIRIDGEQEIGDPTGGEGDVEWVREERDEAPSNTPWSTSQVAPAAYKKDQPLEIEVTLIAEPDVVTGGRVAAEMMSDGYGDFEPADITFSDGEGRGMVMSSMSPDSIAIEELDVTWSLEQINIDGQIVEVDFELEETQHRVYTLFDDPRAPMDEPWAVVLELAAGMADDQRAAAEAVAELTRGVHASNWRDLRSEARFIDPRASLVYNPQVIRSTPIGGGCSADTFASQRYDLENFMAFLGQASVIQQCNDNSNFLSAILARSLGIDMSPLWIAHAALELVETPTGPECIFPDLMVEATYFAAGGGQTTVEFTFHQFGFYENNVYDPSTRPTASGDPFLGLSLESYLDAAFPGQRAEGFVTRVVHDISIGTVDGSPAALFDVQPSRVSAGSTTTLILSGDGFDSSTVIVAIEAGTATAAEGVELGIPVLVSGSEMTIDIVVEPTSAPRTIELVTTQAHSGVIFDRLDLVIEPAP